MHEARICQDMEKNVTWASCGALALAIVLLVALSAPGMAQVSQSCLNNLGPCLNYLNGTQDPPDICCEPLKEIIKSDSECLCSLMSNQGAIQAQLLGINVTEAQELPGRCGQRVNPLACLSGSPSSGSSNQDSSGVGLRRPSPIKLMMPIAISMAIRILWQ